MSEDSSVFAHSSAASNSVSTVAVQRMKTDWADSRSVKNSNYWDVFERLGTISNGVRDAMVTSARAMLSGHYLPQQEEDGEQGEGSEDSDDEVSIPTFNISNVYPVSNSDHYYEKRANSKFCRIFGFDKFVLQQEEEQVQKGWAGQKQGKLKGNQKSGKAEAIRNRISEKKAAVEDDRFTEFYNDTVTLKNQVPAGVIRSSDSVQYVIARLMAHIVAIHKDHQTVSLEKKIDLFFGVSKIIDALPGLEVKNHLDNTVSTLGEDLSVTDLRTVYNRFCDTVFPDRVVPVLRAADEFPRMFQFTSYDDFLPTTRIQLFDSQLRMLQLIATQLSSNNTTATSGLLAVLNTVPGQGKTTLVLAIAKMIMASSLSRVLYKPGMGRKGRSRGDARNKVGGRTLKLLYVTPKTLLPVAKQVGSLLFESTPFGIAYTETSSAGVKTFDISENYNCYSGKKKILFTPPVAILCSPSTAIEILKHNEEQKTLKANSSTHDEFEAKTDYIVFYDEPTAVGMDQSHESNFVVRELADFIKVMPKWTILSCATLKNVSAYSELCDIFRTKYPGAVLETVNNSKIPIGASIMNYAGQVQLPHMRCTTRDQLEHVINKLEDEMILQKFYTHRIVHSMYVHLNSMLAIPDELHYGAYIRSHEITQDSIQRLAIEYLRHVLAASADDETVVARFCVHTMTMTSFNTTNILSNVSKLRSQTLAVASNPVTHFKTAVREHYNSILKEYKADSFSGIYNTYSQKYSEWEHQLDLVIKREETKKSGGKKKGRDNATDEDGNKKKSNHSFDIATEGSLEMRVERWKSEHPCPILTLSSKFCIRSLTQSKERIRGMIDYASPGYSEMNPNSGDDEADDMLKVMLAAGVGVYASSLDESYLKIVTEQMEKGNMSIVFVNDDICYGVNYPIENIVILDTPLMMDRSINTLLQLISRAGRKGKSDKANVWISDPVLVKLQEYIVNPEFEDVEFNNIRIACAMALDA